MSEQLQQCQQHAPGTSLPTTWGGSGRHGPTYVVQECVYDWDTEEHVVTVHDEARPEGKTKRLLIGGQP